MARELKKHHRGEIARLVLENAFRGFRWRKASRRLAKEELATRILISPGEFGRLQIDSNSSGSNPEMRPKLRKKRDGRNIGADSAQGFEILDFETTVLFGFYPRRRSNGVSSYCGCMFKVLWFAMRRGIFAFVSSLKKEATA